jgi:hypothetical protein
MPLCEAPANWLAAPRALAAQKRQTAAAPNASRQCAIRSFSARSRP